MFRMVLFYLSQVLLYLLPFTTCQLIPSKAGPLHLREGPTAQGGLKSRQSWNVSESRAVYLVSDIVPSEYQVSTIDGKTIFNSYVALYIMGTKLDGPLRIEMSSDLNILSSGQATLRDISMVRAFDLGTGSNTKVIAAKAGRTASLQGNTTHRNKDFLDPDTGLGIVATAWASDCEYRVGPKYKASLNSGHALTQRILKLLDITPNAKAQTMWKRADRWQYEFQDSSSYNITQLYHDVLSQPNPSLKKRVVLRPRGNEQRALNPDRERTVWLMKNTAEPENLARAKSLIRRWGPGPPVAVTPKQLPIVAESSFGVGPENTEASLRRKARRARFVEEMGNEPSGQKPISPNADDPVPAGEKVPAPPADGPHRLDILPVDDAGSLVTPPKTAPRGTPAEGGKPASGPPGVSTDVGETQKTTFANIGKELRTIGVTVSAAVSAVGVAADVALGLFIMILDFANGEWALGAVAGVGAVTAAGVVIAAELAGEGPIGWAAALLIGLFTMLPGLLNKKPAGHIGNNLEILQWSFYGDRDYTGNEECNQQAKVKNCTVLNGPGSLTKGTSKYCLCDMLSWFRRSRFAQRLSNLR